jgi:hypothetical protein
MTPLNRVRVEKLVKKFPSFYGIRKFISVHTTRHWCLWAGCIQSIPYHPISLRSVLLFSSHLHLGLPSCVFPWGFYNQNIVRIFQLSHPCYMHRPCHPPWFYQSNNFWWSEQVTKLITVQPSPASCPSSFLGQHNLYSPFKLVCRKKLFIVA